MSKQQEKPQNGEEKGEEKGEEEGEEGKKEGEEEGAGEEDNEIEEEGEGEGEKEELKPQSLGGQKKFLDNFDWFKFLNSPDLFGILSGLGIVVTAIAIYVSIYYLVGEEVFS